MSFFSRQTITLNNTPVGKFRASWLLLKESWRFLKADPELLLVPIITTILMIFCFGVLLIGILLSGVVSVGATASDTVLSLQAGVFLVGTYIISAFVLSFAKAMVTHTVVTRSSNQNATLGQSFKVAFKHMPALLLWSIMSATVGLVLRTISERSERLGQLLAGVVGGAWNVLTYFVVPAIVVDNMGAFSSLTRSGSVFKKTWGESLISNLSLGVIFLVGHIIAVGLFLVGFFIGTEYGLPILAMLALLLWIVWIFVAISLEQILKTILNSLLYVYATSEVHPTNFNTELLQNILVKKNSASDTQTVAADNIN